MKCAHSIDRAAFDEDRGQWDLRIGTKDGAIDDVCDILVSATGFLSKWRWPDIPGLHDFKGKMYHSANWATDFNADGKRIGVIGNGSSAIQIIPQVVDNAAHVTNFIRNPTYITPGLGSAIIGGQSQYHYSEEERCRFQDHPEELKQYRKRIQAGSNKSFEMFMKNSSAQEAARKQTAAMMKEKLGGDEELSSKLIPDWEVGCRRATPGPGYLESFKRENVSLVTTSIDRVEANGIRTTDGQLHELDVIVCATGFDVSHRPAWPLIGRNGLTLAEAWKDEPVSYLSLAAPAFPNLWFFSGPNSPVGHGSLMAGLGWSADWMCQWMRKIAEEDIKYVVPKQEAVDDFDAYADEIMQTLVWSGGCRSWYKSNRVDGKVTAVWAGSVIGYHEMVEHIRAEDFEIVHRSKNRFRYVKSNKPRIVVKGTDLGQQIHGKRTHKDGVRPEC